METVEARLENARKDLLDLSLRNPLINYRVLKGKGLQIIDEVPEQIFRILVVDEKPMSFLPIPERERPEDPVDTTLPAKDPEETGLYLPQPDEVEEGTASRHKDDKFQTGYTSEQLQRRLLNTYYAARTSLEEQGVNTLFLALALLQWYESDQSDIQRQAPLLLIPVELYRTNVQEKFRLKYNGEDIEPNLSLEAKLKQEFGLELPEFPDSDEANIPGYFGAIARQVQHLKRWEVDSGAVHLGFFSFSKFLMYKDLDSEKWPEEGKPSSHPLISAVLGEGFREPEPKLKDGDFIDDHIDLADLHPVVDADSSQTLAIFNVLQGRNLVIQGPPGTGKSQTITNLIAEAVAAGKRVLFVSEKMAALEVVKRRLDAVGLGPACLQLHSHNTQKRALLDELRRTLLLGKPTLHDDGDLIESLKSSRNSLNEYAAAVNTALGATETSPFRAVGQLLKLQADLEDSGFEPLESNVVEQWTRADFRKCLTLVEDVQALLASTGLPSEHLFWGSRCRHLLPADKQKIVQISARAEEVMSSLTKQIGRLATLLKINPAKDLSSLDGLLGVARQLLQRPDITGISFAGKEWLDRHEELEELIRCGATLQKLKTQFGRILKSEAWNHDLVPIRDTLQIHSRRWWRLLSAEYRKARKQLLGLCVGKYSGRIRPLLDIAHAVVKARECREKLDGKKALLYDFFQGALRDDWAETDWQRLAAILKWVSELEELRKLKDLSAEIYQYHLEPADKKLAEEISATEKLRQDHAKAIEEPGTAIDLDQAVRFPSGSFAARSFQEQAALVRRWREDVDSLQEMVRLNHAIDKLQERRLGFLLPVVLNWKPAATHLVNLFQHCWYSSVLNRGFEERPILRNFDQQGHESNLERFRRLDTELLELNRHRLAAKHWERLPKETGGGQLRILFREFEKKRRHLPIRKLMEKAGRPIQSIKPVFMMSPLSIAMYLPPDSVHFALVIFDEASQVKPVDAFGALLRGTQAVVVGDKQQLPPTNFFDRITEADEDDPEDEATADVESVLGLFCAQAAPQAMLRWHYRSRHESLIALSNQEFYESMLVVFPSPDASRESCGLKFHCLPNTAYEPGKRINLEEARQVAAAAMEHAREHPELTLGIAAFSLSQMQIIQDQLELLRRNDTSCEDFFSSHPREPFFVKNLENVQGDERDVIFISTGYGKTRDGYVAHNFGPLNRDGGERRLNVLITRSRLRCEVFTNMQAADIDLNRSRARGVVALKRFLEFAETGRLDVPMVSGRDVDSAFEESVAEELRKLGYQTQSQVGTGGFFIDLAVVDPEKPGRYLIGIECDGASYHSSRSARDRDRLRQQVLENLGWKIHRIWSTDWFRSPQQQLRRTVASIESAKIGRPSQAGPKKQQSRTIPREVIPEMQIEEIKSRPSHVADYTLAKIRITIGESELHNLPAGTLANFIREIVNVESPVHMQEVARRITEGAGLRRTGGRIKDSVTRAAKLAEANGWIKSSGDFLWRSDMVAPPIRSRANLSPLSRGLQFVAPAEIEAAVLLAVRVSHGITREEAIQEVSRYFGYARTTEGISDDINRLIEQMLRKNLLEEKSGIIVEPRN